MLITSTTNTPINRILLIAKNQQIIILILEEVIIKNKTIITEDSFNLQLSLPLNNRHSNRFQIISITTIIIINTLKIVFQIIIITIHFLINQMYILNNKIKCNTLHNNKQCLSSNTLL